jgi:hypothetical protein
VVVRDDEQAGTETDQGDGEGKFARQDETRPTIGR